ncbi:hypothetical protein MKX78_24035 [Cytobacillus sp. FSL R5-0569]|uniref:hypothetical protein n=1 Tax=Cytobacillus TaxID=2675230 RepID=UPI002781560B|nr:hypothetical protein [Cytobacillus kochii]MDQ0186630.1 hypothetical protein [Cytobacillus kochii]
MSKINDSRIARLVLVITLFLGSFFILNFALKIWIGTFTTSAYTKTLFNIEHCFSLVILTGIIYIYLRIVFYIYNEMKTLGYHKNNEKHHQAVFKADESYNEILKSIVGSLKWIIISMLVMSLIYFFTIKDGVVFFFWCSLGALVLFFIISFLIKEKIIYQSRVFDRGVKLVRRNSIFIYLLILVAFFSIILTLLAFNIDKRVEFQTDKESHRVIVTAYNLNNIDISIEMNNENNENSKFFKMNDLLSYHGVIEVMNDSKSPVMGSNNTSDNMNYQIDKYKKVEKFELDLSEELIEGKNNLDVIITDIDESDKYLIHLNIVIIKQGDKLILTDDHIKIEL